MGNIIFILVKVILISAGINLYLYAASWLSAVLPERSIDVMLIAAPVLLGSAIFFLIPDNFLIKISYLFFSVMTIFIANYFNAFKMFGIEPGYSGYYVLYVFALLVMSLLTLLALQGIKLFLR